MVLRSIDPLVRTHEPDNTRGLRERLQVSLHSDPDGLFRYLRRPRVSRGHARGSDKTSSGYSEVDRGAREAVRARAMAVSGTEAD